MRASSVLGEKFGSVHSILSWFSRVPTASNPADASRLTFNVPWLLGVPRPELILPARLSEWGFTRSCKHDAVWKLRKQQFQRSEAKTDLMDESSKPSRMNVPIQTFPRVIEQSRDKKECQRRPHFSVESDMAFSWSCSFVFTCHAFFNIDVFNFSTLAFRRIAYAWLYM